MQENNLLINQLRELTALCHQAAYDAGWWYDKKSGLDLREVVNNPQNPIEELLSKALQAKNICLWHSEASEAMEGVRKNLMDDKLPHLPMFLVEAADIVIRINDVCGAMNLDLASAIIEKLEFNKTRPDHKPENRAKEGGKSF